MSRMKNPHKPKYQLNRLIEYIILPLPIRTYNQVTKPGTSPMTPLCGRVVGV